MTYQRAAIRPTPPSGEYPQATSYMALSVANMATSGIPPEFNITVGTLYGKDNAALYDKIMSGK